MPRLGMSSTTVACGTTRAFMVVSTSTSCGCANRDAADALNRPTRFSTASLPPTSQSSAFLRAPGMPWAYSGLENRTASAEPIAARHCATALGSGETPSSRSGLNGGTVSSASYEETVTPAGATSPAAASNAALDEPALRLPETVKRCGTDVHLVIWTCGLDACPLAEWSLAARLLWYADCRPCRTQLPAHGAAV